MFASPTAFFIGGLNEREKQFEHTFLSNALKCGYKKFVEPCSGELNISQIASDVGFGSIEASDVTLFSTLLGFYVTGKTADNLNVLIDGRPRTDIVDILYEQLLVRMEKDSGKYYWDVMIRDVLENEEKHKQNIKESLDAVKSRFHGNLLYEPLDIMVHLERVKYDETAIVMANVPTYTGGYEKFYDTGDRISWNEPPYTILNPDTSKQTIKEALEGAKCLVLFYEEAPVGETVFDPLYVRFETRTGMNAYITANDIEKAKHVMNKSFATRGKNPVMTPLKYPLISRDYEFKEDSQIEVIPIGTEACNYYRRLLTHNFVGSSGDSGYAVIIDGMIVGVFGYTSLMFAEPANDTLFLQFSIGIGCTGWRINRLLTMIEKCRCVAEQKMNDLEKFSCKYLQTTMLSRYPESKQHRGLMKLVSKDKDDKTNLNRLVYKGEFVNDSVEEAYKEWISKELSYRKSKK